MLRARAGSGLDFTGLTTGGSTQPQQRLAVQPKILFCRRQGGRVYPNRHRSGE
jgi:hypothetical protein